MGFLMSTAVNTMSPLCDLHPFCLSSAFPLPSTSRRSWIRILLHKNSSSATAIMIKQEEHPKRGTAHPHPWDRETGLRPPDGPSSDHPCAAHARPHALMCHYPNMQLFFLRRRYTIGAICRGSSAQARYRKNRELWCVSVCLPFLACSPSQFMCLSVKSEKRYHENKLFPYLPVEPSLASSCFLFNCSLLGYLDNRLVPENVTSASWRGKKGASLHVQRTPLSPSCRPIRIWQRACGAVARE